MLLSCHFRSSRGSGLWGGQNSSKLHSTQQLGPMGLRQVDLSRNSFSIYGFLSITKFCRAQSQLRILKLFKCELWQFEEKWRFFKAILHLVAADSHCLCITFGVFRHKKVYDDDRGSLCGWASTMPWDFWNVQDFQYSVCIFVQCIFCEWGIPINHFWTMLTCW